MQNYIGKQIDHYQIIEQVGLGGMAVVYKAYDLHLERDVALKLIRTDEIPASQHLRLMQRFEREARAQALFTHPNIVPAYEYGEVDGIPYLVLAFMPGGTLKEYIRKGLSVLEALEILTPIADAVAYAHRMGVLHRDIKPSNIIFSADGVPMLTDFGIAKVLGTTEATLTGTGLGVGTPEYMAPEQWQGNPCEASDQYALGVVLYEALTGQKPYTAETPLAVALKVLNEPLTQPSLLNPTIPEGVDKVIYKALAREPRNRFESMRVFHERLSALLEELRPPEPIVTPEEEPLEVTPDLPSDAEVLRPDQADVTPAPPIDEDIADFEQVEVVPAPPIDDGVASSEQVEVGPDLPIDTNLPRSEQVTVDALDTGQSLLTGKEVL